MTGTHIDVARQTTLLALEALSNQYLPLAAEAGIVDDHFHNYEIVFGLAAAPNLPTHAMDVDSTTVFPLIGGSPGFGTPVQIIGTSDTPVRAGDTYIDLRKVTVTALSSAAGPYVLRIIWGIPTQTSAQAITAGQYTSTYLQNFLGNLATQEFFNVRVPTGCITWAQIKGPVNAATTSILFAMHEYPSPSP